MQTMVIFEPKCNCQCHLLSFIRKCQNIFQQDVDIFRKIFWKLSWDDSLEIIDLIVNYSEDDIFVENNQTRCSINVNVRLKVLTFGIIFVCVFVIHSASRSNILIHFIVFQVTMLNKSIIFTENFREKKTWMCLRCVLNVTVIISITYSWEGDRSDCYPEKNIVNHSLNYMLFNSLYRMFSLSRLQWCFFFHFNVSFHIQSIHFYRCSVIFLEPRIIIHPALEWQIYLYSCI